MNFLSTGFVALDRVLGGGWPIGGSVLVKGPTDSGISSLVMSTLEVIDYGALYVPFQEPLFSTVENIRAFAPSAYKRISNSLSSLMIRDCAKMPDWNRKPKLAIFDGLPTHSNTKAQVCRWAHLEVERASMRRHALVWIAPTMKTTGTTLGGVTVEHEMDAVLYVEKTAGNFFSVQSTKNRNANLDRAVFGFSKNGRLTSIFDVSMGSPYERRFV